MLPLATIWSTLADPWSQALMRQALVEVVLVGLVGGALGCWVVLYGLSYGAESLAHSLFPGLVVAALIGVPLLLGGGGAIIVAAVAIALAGRIRGLDNDTAVAVVVTTLFGLGALLALSADSPPGIQGLLFGDVLGLSRADVLTTAGLAAVVLGGLFLLHGRLLAVGFDADAARGIGVSPLIIESALLVMLALAVLVSVQALGNLLAVAVLVAPAAAARTVGRRVGPMMAVAAALAIGAGVAGLYASYYASTAAGASIAVITVALYLATAAVAILRPS